MIGIMEKKSYLRAHFIVYMNSRKDSENNKHKQ